MKPDIIALIFTALFTAIASFSSFRIYKITEEDKFKNNVHLILNDFASSLAELKSSLDIILYKFCESIVSDFSLRAIIQLLRNESFSNQNKEYDFSDSIKKVLLSAQIKANYEIGLPLNKIKFANYKIHDDFPLTKKFLDIAEVIYDGSYKSLFFPQVHIDNIKKFIEEMISNQTFLKNPDIYFYPHIYIDLFNGLKNNILGNKEYKKLIKNLESTLDIYLSKLYKASAEELLIISKDEKRKIVDFHKLVKAKKDVIFYPVFIIIELKKPHLHSDYEKVIENVKKMQSAWNELIQNDKNSISDTEN